MPAAKKNPSKTSSALTTIPTAPMALISVAEDHVMSGFSAMATLLSKPDLAPGPLVAAYAVIDKVWKKTVEDQRAAANGALKQLLANEGHALENSDSLGAEVDYAGDSFKVVLQKAKSKLPDENLLGMLLASKGIKPETACDAVVTYVPNPTKLQALVAAGKLTQQELETCRKALPEKLLVTKL